MRLEDIGFYTLSDERALRASERTRLWRCELILTDACNFKCPYCRGVRDEYSGTLPMKHAREVVELWISEGLKNVRFSGGEPTLYKGLPELIDTCKKGGVERIAVSSNGSLDLDFYKYLVSLGVNDYSISLDACCASDGDKMAGGVAGAWETVVANIRELAKLTYVTVGMVVTDDNVGKLVETVEFAHGLGVADIRVIPAAQYGSKLVESARSIRPEILAAHPILKYRIDNMASGKTVRGLVPWDNDRCPLVVDDMAVAGGFHFPCIIYLRERGNPIGKVGPEMRAERARWAVEHNTHEDPICRKNCLDVCVHYNNRTRELKCR